MAENAFSSGAISDRELQALEEEAPMYVPENVSDEEFKASITVSRSGLPQSTPARLVALRCRKVASTPMTRTQ